ncbi:MAG: AbrB family transcriptional regulator [Alphaproteobacteria bacterium]|nr:AbrB family transcriptional regulator [Alphaproteobacteria bacterium]MBT7943601.1 AbrB family transcriptional regulator [Alphaproteobacteria bacterium]
MSRLPTFLRFEPRLVFAAFLTLLLGGVGGALFDWLTMPLAWLIGGMVITTIAALAGAPLTSPGRLRNLMIGVLGIMLGSAFTPEVVENATQWSTSILTLMAFVVVLAAAVAVFLNKVAGFDPVTAYFSAAPGSFATMVIMGVEMGGDERNISLIHAIRIMLTVLVIPFWFRFYHGYVPGGGGNLPGLGSVMDFPLREFAILAACALGYPLAKWVRFPAAALLGPMFLSSIAHLTGLTAANPPSELVNLSQLVIGVGLGCRFVGLHVRRVIGTMFLSSGVTLFMLALAASFALGLEYFTGLPFAALWLAFAPGGLAEMTLISLAMNIDTAFVSTHHLVRMLFLVFGTPLVFALIRNRLGAKPKN